MMKNLAYIFFLTVLVTYANPVYAQVSIQTIGATEAKECADNAFSDSQDIEPCVKALRNRNTTRVDRVKTLINRGIIYNNRLEVQLAIDDFNEALRIQPDRSEAFINRGNSWYLAQRYQDALTDYHRALELNTNKRWAVWYNIGLTYQATKEDALAREAYQKALDENPSFSPARDKLAGYAR